MDIRGWRNKEALLRVLYALFLGQVVSFLMAIMAFTASFVTDLGVDTPLTLSFFSYLALALVYGSILLYRRQKLLVPWYWYVLLGFVDVQGNYLGMDILSNLIDTYPRFSLKHRLHERK